MNAPAARAPLAGRGIVITRPAHQAGTLAAGVGAAGGRAILFPVIEIGDPRDPQALHALIDRLHAFDLAIFVSANAVERALDLVTVRGPLPAHLTLVAVGRATRSALARRGASSAVAPAEGADSEALLALPALQEVAGKSIVIFRGEGGRELLGETLIARGAQVEYAECYRRGVPRLDAAPLMSAWSAGELHAFVVTSSEGLRNLFSLIGKQGEARLAGTPVFVPHPRIAQTAHDLGLSCVVTTAAGDAGLLAGLCAYFAPDS